MDTAKWRRRDMADPVSDQWQDVPNPGSGDGWQATPPADPTKAAGDGWQDVAPDGPTKTGFVQHAGTLHLMQRKESNENLKRKNQEPS